MLVRAITLAAPFAAAGLGLGPAPVEAQDEPRVAVLDFSSFMMGEGGQSVNLGKALSAMLVTEFSGREGMQVIERQQINALLDEQDLCSSGRAACSEAESLEIGRLLGLQYVLLGQITSIVDNLRMDIRAVDVETSEIVTVHKKSGRTTDLFQIVVDLADDFSAELHLVPSSERVEIEQIPVAATIEFSRALDFEDRGEIDDAIRHYEATLQIYENHRDARRALERLRGA